MAGFLGLTDSRFQYIVDNLSEEDKEAAEKDLRWRREGRKGGEGEGGMLLLHELSAVEGEVDTGGKDGAGKEIGKEEDRSTGADRVDPAGDDGPARSPC